MHAAYVLKRYPRYSETFIVNEILAHERAGLDVSIYALLPPQDAHFQDIIARVRAPVAYLPVRVGRANALWELQKKVANEFPSMWAVLAEHVDINVRDVLQALGLCLHIKKNHITHLHAHFATSATTVAQLASAIAGIPFTFTAHAKDIFHKDNDFDVLRQKFHQAACAITVSDFNVGYLQQLLEVPRRSLQRIYNGLDLESFCYMPPLERDPVILAVGRLVEKKGFGDLISACHILKNKGVKFSCNIIGDGDLSAALQTQIIHQELGDVVTLLGACPQAEVKQYIMKSAIFAAPCVVGEDGNRDGLPTVLLESMALGTPCVSTDVTGIPEVIENEKTGLMVPQNNPAALAQVLERLLTDRALGLTLARNARQLIEREFDIDANAEKIRACFKSCEPVTAIRPKVMQ